MRFAPLAYLRAHPFSVMALANIIGDWCYVGFAFESDAFVSVPKLFGSLFTLLAHMMLLSYGDDLTGRTVAETGWTARALERLRRFAKRIVACIPAPFLSMIAKKPVAISFGMLALNGVGLLVDAIVRLAWPPDLESGSQIVLGVAVISGCLAFAAADLTKGQRAADILLKIAPALLSMATLANAGLAIATRNPFAILAVAVFTLSNFTGFFTRIRKEKP